MKNLHIKGDRRITGTVKRMRKTVVTTIALCTLCSQAKKKGANQLSANGAADQHPCFGYTIPLLPTSEILCPLPSFVVVQPGLCRIWSETLKTALSWDIAHMFFRGGGCMVHYALL